MKVYVVTMYRWGNHEEHSYVLGVWTNKIVAENYGITEESWRGGKYESEVTEWDLDANECDNIAS
jgi:hypothetical protein